MTVYCRSFGVAITLSLAVLDSRGIMLLCVVMSSQLLLLKIGLCTRYYCLLLYHACDVQVSEPLLAQVHDCFHLQDILGSDHCPVGLVLKTQAEV